MRHRKGLCVYLEVSPLQVQELGAADVVADEGLFVFSQAELLQPDGHLLSAPPLNYTSIEREAPFSVQPPYTRRTQANRVGPRGGTSQKQPQKERGPKSNQTGKRRHKEKWRQQLAKRGLNRFGLVTGTPGGFSGMQVITSDTSTIIPLRADTETGERGRGGGGGNGRLKPVRPNAPKV